MHQILPVEVKHSYKILDTIQSPNDLRKLTQSELVVLAAEIRQFIIEVVATKEGHLGASLGVVELTLALHYAMNTPEDLLVWDVGHQAYVHKIITGRKDVFSTNRQWNGISGFPKREESNYDTFGVGHASTSISAALGMAIASQLNGENKQHIAVIGDASIAGGMAFEALNHAGVSNTNLLVILNDNAIGIDPSVGALKHYLTNLKEGKNPKHQNLFEALNFQYFGPIDGHDISALIEILEKLKTVSEPKLLHVITTKGKGLKQAEENQVLYHAPGKFDSATGDISPKNNENTPPKFQDVFGLTLVDLAKNNPKIIGITPAMPTGSSLKFLMDAFPERAFDVGIAEQHAVTLAAGMATQGFTVFCAIYSTFLQRAYDQVIHDVCLQNLPVIFCLDRAGLVGEDGATHHGVFDIAYLQCIPNLTILAPKDELELQDLLYTISEEKPGPVAIRYPRGKGLHIQWKKIPEKINYQKAKTIKKGSKIAVLSTGFTAHLVKEAFEKFENTAVFSHYHFGCIKPFDEECLLEISATHKAILTIEDGVIKGAFGEAIASFLAKNQKNISIINLGIPDLFIEHGTISQLQEYCKFDPENIFLTLQKLEKSLS